MKRKLFAVVLIVLSFFTLAGCTDETEELSWKDLFQVTYTRIEESEFDNVYDELDALLNGTYVFPAHEYEIKNITNDVLRNCRAVFQVTFRYSDDSFEYDWSVGTLQQGETKVLNQTDGLIELKIEEAGYDKTKTWEHELIKIEYEY